MRYLYTTLALVLTTSLSVAGAQSMQAAKAVYAQGQWQKTADIAAALKTSEGYAFAAEALNNGAMLLPDNQRKAVLDKAMNYARQAIAADKKNPHGYFELARTQGRMVQFAGVLQSLNLAKEVKKNLDMTLSLNRNYANAYIVLGAWNANLASKGFAATAATGANKNQVKPNFDKAIALDPSSHPARIEYGNALLLLKDTAGAKAQFQKLASMPASDFWTKRDVVYAQQMLQKLK